MSDKQSFYELMKQFPQKTIQTIPVSELILFESILKSSAPKYVAMERFKQKGN